MTDTTDTVCASEALEKLTLLIAEVEAGNFDQIDAVADKWAASVGVARMMNAVASVFEKHASQEIMDRFRAKLNDLMHLSFVEGAAQGVLQFAPVIATPTIQTGALVEALRRIADETQRQQLPITALVHEIATAALASIGEAQSAEPVPATEAGEVEGDDSCAGGQHCCCCDVGEPCCDCGLVMPSKACIGVKCWCGHAAAKKVGEEILFDDPNPNRHNLTAYVCAVHYAQMMGPTGASQVGAIAAALATQPATSQEGEAQSDATPTAGSGEASHARLLIAQMLHGDARAIDRAITDGDDRVFIAMDDVEALVSGMVAAMNAPIAASPAQSDGAGE